MHDQSIHLISEKWRWRVTRFVRSALLALVMASLHGCATHCGLLNYCDIPKEWSVADTFTVAANDSRLCVSGIRRSSCSSKGMYQSGARAVELHYVDDDEEDSDVGHIATLTVSGGPGEEFTASCFQYNGGKFLGLTEVLIGVEIRDRTGRIVARHPTGPVTRRNTLLLGC